MQIRFGVFIVDTDTRQILRRGEPVQLSPKSFQLLQILLEERPRVVSKQELMKRLWPDVTVEEENVKARIREIRAVLAGNEETTQWIRTAHGYGYAFSGATADDGHARHWPAGRSWWILHGARRIVVECGESYVGRDPRCEVWIDDESVSRRHALVVVSDSGLLLQDLDSKNGTYVEDAPLSGGPVEIIDGNNVRFGSVTLVFRSTAPMEPTQEPLPPNNS